MNARRLKALLHLTAHPEGGYYTQSYKSDEEIPAEALPLRYSGPRSTSTAIYYLLEPGTFSEIHRLISDEVFHFYLGDPVEMFQFWPDGSMRAVVIGNELEKGMSPQVVVPKNVWQGSRLQAGGKFALLGCTVSPGFEYTDYTTGVRDELTQQYPEYAEVIAELTRR